MASAVSFDDHAASPLPLSKMTVVLCPPAYLGSRVPPPDAKKISRGHIPSFVEALD